MEGAIRMSIYDFGVGGFDLQFHCPALSSSEYLVVCSKIAITATDAQAPATAKSYLKIAKGDDNEYTFSMLDKNSKPIETYTYLITNLGLVRVVFHNEFCTVYVDGYWVHTFGFTKVYHPDDPEVGLKASGEITVTEIRLKELSDWREAIWVDLETSTQNAISTAILQRPVNIYPNYRGEIVFEYSPLRDRVDLEFVHIHEINHQESMQAAADAIVYFTRTGVVTDKIFARQVGFVTRFYRLPDLDNGAIAAARKIMDRERQSRKVHSSRGRLNPVLAIGDIAVIHQNLSATETLLSESFIVEDINLRLTLGAFEMTVQGRDADA